MSDLDSLVREDRFPGNGAALAELVDSLADKQVTLVTGAGVSVPLAPTWQPLLQNLVKTASSEGFIAAEDLDLLTSQVASDPLELATTLEESLTTVKFRAKLVKIFELDGKSTDAHELCSKIAQVGIVTFNYDEGHSTAFVKCTGIMPRILRPEDKYELTRWVHGEMPSDGRLPIVHWHGSIVAPDRMILTADDYNDFYSKAENRSFIEDIWRSHRLLVVGFSFTDPFLTRLAEGVLRTLSSDNRHFALIGYRSSDTASPIMRRTYARKYRLTPIFYEIVVADDGSEDHSALSKLLSFLAEKAQSQSKALTIKQDQSALAGTPTRKESMAERAEREFRAGLFEAPHGATLYAEPTLYKPTELRGDNVDKAAETISVADLVASERSFIVAAPWEYGGTTLARRLSRDLNQSGEETFIRNASELPKYKKGLLQDNIFSPSKNDRNIILDNVDVKDNERLIKEILGLSSFKRIILITKGSPDSLAEASENSFDDQFDFVRLNQLAREDIRTIATQLYDTFDSDLISGAVEKSYDDLLALCIPLTPANVVMYLTVLYKQGSFVPLNRLHIMDHYIRGLLYRPSDALADSITVDHKIDILASFVFNLREEGKTSFAQNDWERFSADEMSRSLSYFDASSLLVDLVSSRFIVKIGQNFHFKYKLFYAYFLGQYIHQRHDVLNGFIAEGSHLTIEGLVEVLAGLSRDNTVLVSDLVVRVENAVKEFNDQYKIGDFDPYRDLKWVIKKEEEEALWRPITERLASGPAPGSEVDAVKRSIMAEQKTADQIVLIREFSEFEKSAVFTQKNLIAALRESRGLDRDLKLRSMRAIYSVYKIIMQVGFIFAPIIATRRHFVWNNVAFANLIEYQGDAKNDEVKQASIVAAAVPRSIAETAATEIGSPRLGDVFKFLALKGDLSDFESLINTVSLVHAKPNDWEGTSRWALGKMNREALYLRYTLSGLMEQFRHAVNTSSDRIALKRLVAVIQAKRRLKTDAPTNKMITSLLAALDKVSYFGEGSDNPPIGN